MMFPKGSEWRRWDLHVHTKGTLKEDQFTSEDFNDFCVTFFRKAIENEIAAIGITDYFSIDNYQKVCQFVDQVDSNSEFSDEEKAQIKGIFLIPNVELRMLPSTHSGKLINIHCLFNPDFLDHLDNHFFNKLRFSAGPGNDYPMNREGMIELGRSINSDLDPEEAYVKGVSEFVVSHERLQELRDSDKKFSENVIIAVSNSSNDGASGLQKHYELFEGVGVSSLDAVRRAIYKISDCIFSGNPKDAEYFSGRGTDNAQAVGEKCGNLKPCIHGSDAHTEGKLFSPDENRYCWIKADTTFNGLRQILCEPNPGDRVWIGQRKPDQKDGFKVINKIRFQGTSDFPQKIAFNPNLCSIIGSRSAGKSALLAYIADGVDSAQAREKKPKGPGEGFPWENVDFSYSIEWENGTSNEDNPGKIVYIPQNFLYEMSGKPEEIKNKILPVLTKKLPMLSTQYKKAIRDIKDINDEIRREAERWFEQKDRYSGINDDLENLGSLQAVQDEKKKIDSDIENIKEKFKLQDTDVEKLQQLTERVSILEQKISSANRDLELVGQDGKRGEYFRKIDFSPMPSIEDLSDLLKGEVQKKLEELSKQALGEANLIVSTYAVSLEKDIQTTQEALRKSNEELSEIKEKQAKNLELDALIEKSSELKETIEDIANKSEKLKECGKQLSTLQDRITDYIKQRSELIHGLIHEIQTVDQSEIKEMSFGIEAKIDERDIGSLRGKINIQNKSEFVSSGNPDISKIRMQSAFFLEALYSGDQKIKGGQNNIDVAVEALTLTERILFTAEMEGDRIGGFSEPTMTPGKRALFALRLMLAESEDTWPLLIDQPEDDLDSRSIYDDIVPFLREKKKERQIIMVSHNANLVIGADSEQIIVSNRHGEDRKNENGGQFNYSSGSIENSHAHDPDCTDTLKSQGIREHACQILEGGKSAFEKRGRRYDINRS